MGILRNLILAGGIGLSLPSAYSYAQESQTSVIKEIIDATKKANSVYEQLKTSLKTTACTVAFQNLRVYDVRSEQYITLDEAINQLVRENPELFEGTDLQRNPTGAVIDLICNPKVSNRFRLIDQVTKNALNRVQALDFVNQQPQVNQQIQASQQQQNLEGIIEESIRLDRSNYWSINRTFNLGNNTIRLSTEQEVLVATFEREIGGKVERIDEGGPAKIKIECNGPNNNAAFSLFSLVSTRDPNMHIAINGPYPKKGNEYLIYSSGAGELNLIIEDCEFAGSGDSSIIRSLNFRVKGTYKPVQSDTSQQQTTPIEKPSLETILDKLVTVSKANCLNESIKLGNSDIKIRTVPMLEDGKGNLYSIAIIYENNGNSSRFDLISQPPKNMTHRRVFDNASQVMKSTYPNLKREQIKAGSKYTLFDSEEGKITMQIDNYTEIQTNAVSDITFTIIGAKYVKKSTKETNRSVLENIATKSDKIAQQGTITEEDLILQYINENPGSSLLDLSIKIGSSDKAKEILSKLLDSNKARIENNKFYLNNQKTNLLEEKVQTPAIQARQEQKIDRKIAYFSKEGNIISIYTMDIDGSNKEKVIDLEKYGRKSEFEAYERIPEWAEEQLELMWSPDKTKIAIYSRGATRGSEYDDLWVVDLNTKKLRRLTNDKDKKYMTPEDLDDTASLDNQPVGWSPDSQEIIFNSIRRINHRPVFSVQSINTDTLENRMLDRGRMAYSVSTKGRVCYELDENTLQKMGDSYINVNKQKLNDFIFYKKENGDIYRLNSSSNEETNLTNTPKITEWSPTLSP